ncbi:E3 ubiquitin-protein ligase RNF14-like [Leptopilina boulardi]|uniref:E3 ubiquitin-protein ligase RNF14-like n=1 Tax=Leptopilina boulardi TaxID=63433 RepID=UPI0021F5F3E1|nr:E3 ubiquitin-protein ligase RNF14-like [Leptopilina boulardi]
MDNEKQKDELTALESIYNSEEFSYKHENNEYECTLKIFLNLSGDFYFSYKDIRQIDEESTKVQISHLPPITVLVTLPNNYPSLSPPNFTLISSWLRPPLLSRLCRKLDQLWKETEGVEILFTWFAFLQNETLEFLNLKENLNINQTYTRYKIALENQIQPELTMCASNILKKSSVDVRHRNEMTNTKNHHHQHFSKKKNKRQKNNKNSFDKRAVFDRPVSSNPVQMLIDYNEMRNEIEFKRNFYTCKICFSDKLGIDCTQFIPCSHVFCKDCIVGYLEVRIKDGAVQDISCPEDKCTSEATPGQIKDLVSPELFSKYDSILLSATLSTMSDIVYCPRRHCQYPVSREVNEVFATCPSCQYAFCLFCKMVYHGIEPCKMNSADKQSLMKEYKNASPEGKLQLEKRYGKKQLQLMIDNTMSENWITNNSKNCPHCKVAIEKSDGCNKMACGHCNTFFCWLCSTRLDPRDPYQHYRNPNSSCFNRVNQGILMNLGDDDDEDDEVDDSDDDDDPTFVVDEFIDYSDDDNSTEEIEIDDL